MLSQKHLRPWNKFKTLEINPIKSSSYKLYLYDCMVVFVALSCYFLSSPVELVLLWCQFPYFLQHKASRSDNPSQTQGCSVLFTPTIECIYWAAPAARSRQIVTINQGRAALGRQAGLASLCVL